VNQLSTDIHAEALSLLEKYIRFASTANPFESFSGTAQCMLFTRSCNAFASAITLCLNGLFVDSYNSARVGLEAGWLAIILSRSDEHAREWLTLVPSDTSQTEPEKRYRNTYGSLPWIRKEVSVDSLDLEQRTNIYQILSTKSHANVAAMFFVCPTASDPNDLCLYEPGTLDSDEHQRKFAKGILYCLKYLLHDVQRQCSYDFGVTWSYDNMSLFNIAGVGFPDKDTGVRVVPSKVNAAYQGMVLTKFAKIQAQVPHTA